jgi:FKBP-type peptidyl-prolyl cis-trans isomerase SlyD
MPFMLELAAGLHPMAFRVKKVTPDGTVVLDGNHPLAGKTLRFEVTVEEVRWASPEEIKAGEPSPDELPDQEVFARVKRR